MRKSLVLGAIACLVTFSAVGGAQEKSEGTDTSKDPHRALRKAVDDIRTQYATQAHTYDNFVYHNRMNRPGLGIILGAGFFDSAGDHEEGAEIVAVTPGSPADEAGLQPGDVVVAWNGERLARNGKDSRWVGGEASRDLIVRSRELEEGEAVTLRFLRDGEEVEVTVVARELDFGPGVSAGWVGRPDFKFRGAPGVEWQSAEPWFLPRGWLDMEMVELNPGLGQYFGSDTGVLVVQGPEGDETLGLQSGDVILTIGGREVKSPEHVMRILRSYEPDEELTIDIVRHGRSQTLTGTVPETSFRFGYSFRRSEESE